LLVVLAALIFCFKLVLEIAKTESEPHERITSCEATKGEESRPQSVHQQALPTPLPEPKTVIEIKRLTPEEVKRRALRDITGKGGMSLILQPRDHELLLAVKRFGVLSTVQICLWFFNSVAKTTALRRIRLLEEGHYLKRGVTLENGTNTWSLGFKGRELMAVDAAVHFTNRNSIHHDVLLNDVRRKLESFGLAKDVTPEFELKSEVFRNYSYRNAKEQLVPDALLFESVRSQPWVISLELELTVKAEKRYEKIFRQYSFKDSINRIWYFCNSANESNRILAFARKHWPTLQGRLCFSVVDDFLKAELPQIWTGASGRWVGMNEFGFDHFKLPVPKNSQVAPAHTATQGVSIESGSEIQIKTGAKLLDLQPNSLIPTSLREGPRTPDPSPPTNGGKGSGVRGQEEDGMREFRDQDELKECG